MMDLTVQRLNGETFCFSEEGIKTLDFVIQSPSPIANTDKIDGRHGFVDLGTTYDGRSMTGNFILESEQDGFSNGRNKVFALLDSRESFYLIDNREPERRWFVKVSAAYALDQIRNYGIFSVTFVSPSPFAESVESTLGADRYFQVSTHEPVQYTFDSNTFRVWNDGEPIDPREHRLVITFKGVSENLTIRNLTNDLQWSYNGTTKVNESLILEGIRATKSGASIFRDTNRQLITLSSGWNDFEVLGASDFEISFDFRFLYI